MWDGMFVHWYCLRFVGKSPFGMTGSGIDLRSYWMGMRGCEWVESRKGRIKHALGLTGLAHTHNAGDDTAELANVFEAILAARERWQPSTGRPQVGCGTQRAARGADS